MERLFEVTSRDGRRGYTLEVRVSNDAAIRLYELRFKSRGIGNGYYPDNRRRRADHVEDPVRRAGERLILALETSCDETAAALVTEDGNISPTSSPPGRPARALRRGRPEVASRRHLELVTPVVRDALEASEGRSRRCRARGHHAGSGVDRRASRRPRVGQGARVALRLPLVPVDHLHGHIASLYLRPTWSSRAFSLRLLASGDTSSSTSGIAAVTEPSGRRSTMLPVRRSTKALACSVSVWAAPDRPPRA